MRQTGATWEQPQADGGPEALKRGDLGQCGQLHTERARSLDKSIMSGALADGRITDRTMVSAAQWKVDCGCRCGRLREKLNENVTVAGLLIFTTELYLFEAFLAYLPKHDKLSS